ncbi:hypothetical protein [Streptomyces sp. NBC_01601]|uniref:hypothetical protein n=1 Tax=Streptomyces sp. NBC_01601 TaxID=2975892 RepID=UPI002E2B9119|nr:hypothetical protein [Streptomyces sp. NBC_01601]
MSSVAQPAEAPVVIDPGLDADLAQLIRATAPSLLSSPDPAALAAPWTGVIDAWGKPMVTSSPMLIALGLLAGGAWAVVAPVASLTVAGAAAVPEIRKLARQRNDVVRVGAVRDQYVLPWELVDDAAVLLLRAVRACEQIMNSSVHELDLVDSARNATRLPVEQWEIAVTLRAYSRLTGAEPDSVAGDNAREVLRARRQAMSASLASIRRRVEALETYAAQTGEADRRLRELRQIEALTEDNDEVLDLLARTARDEHAIAELRSMQRLQPADEDFAMALAVARDAAVIALSPPVA